MSERLIVSSGERLVAAGDRGKPQSARDRERGCHRRQRHDRRHAELHIHPRRESAAGDDRESFFSNRTIAPNTGGAPFTVDIPINVPPGTSTEGTAAIVVTGTDTLGGIVDASRTIFVLPELTGRPATLCQPDETTLCMNDGRFKAEVDWRDFDNNTGPAMVTDGQRFEDGGWFFFGGSTAGSINANGLDLLVQLLDRCTENNHFWVFTAGATDVEVTLTVTDTQMNQTRTYHNDLGMPSPAITDTSAFATCP